MNKEESINNLKNYIEQDAIYKENKPQSDFDKFCINHCKDIETVLNYIEELEYNNEILKKLPNAKDKLIDTLKKRLFDTIDKETLRKIKANTDTYRDFTEEVLKLL